MTDSDSNHWWSQIGEVLLSKLQADLTPELRREFKVPDLPPGVMPKGASVDAAPTASDVLNLRRSISAPPREAVSTGQLCIRTVRPGSAEGNTAVCS